MKPWQRSRVSKIAAATVLFLVVALNSPPSLPSVPEALAEPPTPEEIRVLEEVAAWVLGRPIAKGFRAFSEDDVVAAVRKRRRSFELFRSYGEEATRWELVRRLPYGELIHSAARRYAIDGLLLASIVEAESGFDPLAVSPRGALGLMQIMPATAEIYSTEELMEPSANIDLGARYLVTLLEEFDGDLALALAAYNAGPGNVRRFGGVPPFRETRRYVDSVLTRYVHHQRDVWQSSGSPALLF